MSDTDSPSSDSFDFSSFLAPTESDPNQPTAEDVAAAKILSNYIEFAETPATMPPVPDAWQPVFQAVGEVQGGGRTARWVAFIDAITGTPHHYKFLAAIDQTAPPRENRGTLGRKIWTAEDALGDPPPMHWLVDDLFIRPSLNVLVGDAGSKKTLFALDLAVSIALGKPWLGRTVTRSNALIIDEETGRPRLWSRIHDSLVAHGGDAQTHLYFMSLPGFDLRTNGDFKILRKDVDDLAAGFIVIDALADVMRGGDENTIGSVTPLLNNLRLLAEECHAAILLVHHNNRSGAFRGSSHISAAVDLMLSIQSPAESTLITLKPLKTRYASPSPFAARAVFQPGSFHLTPADQPNEPLATFSLVSQRILDFLALNGSATTAEIVSQIYQHSPGSLRQSLHQLANSGHITRLDGGGRGSVATYGLSQK